MIRFLVVRLYFIAACIGSYTTNCYAESTNVYCASNKDWKWLVNDSNSYIDVIGYWRTVWLSNDLYIKYFEMSGGKVEFNRLKDHCIKKFGKEYNIVQPAGSRYDDWLPFLVENKYIVNGRFVIYKQSSKIDIPYIYEDEKIYLKNIYSLNDANYNFLTFEDLKSMCLLSIRSCW